MDSSFARRMPRLFAALVALVLLAGAAAALAGLSGCGEHDDPGSAASAVSPSPSVSASVADADDEGTFTIISGGGESADDDSGDASADGSASAGSTASTAQSSSTTKSTSTPKPEKTSDPGDVPSAPRMKVCGKVGATTYFAVAKLKSMSTVSASYFSRGKDPKEATNTFVGVRLIDILNAAGLSGGAQRVTLTAADGYSASFSMRQVTADYIDETHPGVTLPMIIAYSEDGVAYAGDHPFRLVMGQSVAGEYNRQYWVRLVATITVL